MVLDAAAPADARPGRYTLGPRAAELTPEGRVVLADGDGLAASALRMARAIGGVMERAGVPLADAVGMATWVSGRWVYRAASGTEPRPRAE